MWDSIYNDVTSFTEAAWQDVSTVASDVFVKAPEAVYNTAVSFGHWETNILTLGIIGLGLFLLIKVL